MRFIDSLKITVMLITVILIYAYTIVFVAAT